MSRKINIFTSLTAGCPSAIVNNFFGIAEMSEANLASYLATKGLTYSQLKDIWCTFITGCDSDGYLGKIGALHPFVGDDAVRQKYNMLNPLDTDAAFRLTFFGGLTHSATGILGNGVNGYIDTHWNFTTEASVDAAGFMTYHRRVVTSRAYGVLQGAIYAFHNYAGNCQVGSGIISYSSATHPSTRTWMSYRNASNFNETIRDGVVVGTNAASPASLPNANFLYLALNQGGGTGTFINSNEICFGAMINGAFTQTEALNFRTRIDALQLALGNNV